MFKILILQLESILLQNFYIALTLRWQCGKVPVK